MRDLDLRKQLGDFGKRKAYGPGDPPTEAEKKATAQKKAQENANNNLNNLGANTGGAKNKRTVTGTSSYIKKGKKVERQAKTAKEIAAWKKSTPEQRSKYQDKEISVSATASDFGKDKPSSGGLKRETPPVKVPGGGKSKGTGMFFNQGSNAHNMSSGGSTTLSVSRKKQKSIDFSDSYTSSPKKTISGRDNTFNSREMTSDEKKVYESKFSIKGASPYGSTKKQWNDYISGGLKKIAKHEANVAAKEAKQQKVASIRKNKKATLNAKNAAKAKKLENAKVNKKASQAAALKAKNAKTAKRTEALRLAKEKKKNKKK